MWLHGGRAGGMEAADACTAYPPIMALASPSPTRRRFIGTAGLAGLGFLALQAEDKPAASLRFGICTGLKNARQAADAGADFLEESVSGTLNPDAPESEFRKQLEAIKACPLPVPAFNGYIRRPDLKCVGPAANHDQVMAYCRIALERAGRAGARTIVFGSAGSRKVPDGWDRAKAMDQFAALLKAMGPAAADHGLVVALEPLNVKECNFLNRIGEVAEAAARADHPAIRSVADLYHMKMGGDTPDDLRKAMPFVHHIEIAQQDGRKLPAPGGEDFVPFFKVLHQASFRGTLSMEGSWKPDDLAPAFAELRRQWAAAGA